MPPSRPISMAKRGSETPSMAAARMGSSTRRPQSSHETSTSFGLTVTVPGTRAMSSNPYATRAFRPRPTHMPMPPSSYQSATAWESPASCPLNVVKYRSRRLPLSSRTLAGGSGRRSRVKDAEAFEGQVRVHHLDGPRNVLDEAHQSPRGHHPGSPLHLALHAFDESVDQAGVSVDHPGLDVGDRVGPDDRRRPDQVDPEEAGRSRGQRLRRRRDA